MNIMTWMPTETNETKTKKDDEVDRSEMILVSEAG